MPCHNRSYVDGPTVLLRVSAFGGVVVCSVLAVAHTWRLWSLSPLPAVLVNLSNKMSMRTWKCLFIKIEMLPHLLGAGVKKFVVEQQDP